MVCNSANFSRNDDFVLIENYNEILSTFIFFVPLKCKWMLLTTKVEIDQNSC